MTPAETDKNAIDQKFMAEIAQHTLDDVSGKALISVAQKLRSTYFAEQWSIELLRLKGKLAVDSEFYGKVSVRLQEAQQWARRARTEKHLKQMQTKKPEKSSSSLGNRTQVAAIILQGYIVRSDVYGSRKDRIDMAVEDARDLIEKMQKEDDHEVAGM